MAELPLLLWPETLYCDKCLGYALEKDLRTPKQDLSTSFN